MTDDALDAVRALLPGERVDETAVLQEGERSTVRRICAERDDGTRRSLVVKHYFAGEGWMRETAALDAVPGAVRAPAVVAVGEQLLVVEDLGDGGNVADALLGDDWVAAETAVLGWAEALGELHAATTGSRELFATRLAERARLVTSADESHTPDETWMPARLRDAEHALDRVCGTLGVRIPGGAMAELTGLADRLGPDGTAALTPADTCPDNNVWLGDRLVLLDFEGAQWRHVAWDVAYLTVPWPSCWCAWALPDDVVRRAVDRYRGFAAAGLPAVADETFDSDLEAATAGWSMLSASWGLDYAVGSDVELDQQLDGPVTPSRRQLIMHRLHRAATSTELPALAELADGLRSTLARRWDDAPLGLAPAFRRD